MFKKLLIIFIVSFVLFFTAGHTFAALGDFLRFPGATFEQRQQSYLNDAIGYWGTACDGTNWRDASMQCVFAHLERGTTQDIQWTKDFIDNYGLSHLNSSDHGMMPIAARMAVQYSSELGPIYTDKLVNALIGNGTNALKTGCTPNMRFNDYLSYFILSQDPAHASKTMKYEHPSCFNYDFTYQGRTYIMNDGADYNVNQLTGDWLQYFFDQMVGISDDGQIIDGMRRELRSNTYGYSYIQALNLLYDFSDRPGIVDAAYGQMIKQKAKMILDFLLLEWGSMY